MIPELFRIGSFSVSPFGLMVACGFLGAYFQLRSGLRRQGLGSDEAASTLVFLGGLGGIVGAKVYYAALYGDWHLVFDRSGFVWYGGFVLASLLILAGMRRLDLPTWPTLDAAAPALALGYAIGRLGCFLVGDDYGVPTEKPWGVVFAQGLPPTTAGHLRQQFGVDVAAGVPASELLAVHPTQLYETALALGIWGVGLWLLRRSSRPGLVGATGLALLAVERFSIEFLRAKDDRFFGAFTVAQLISLGVLVLVLAAWWFSAGRRGETPASRPAEG